MHLQAAGHTTGRAAPQTPQCGVFRSCIVTRASARTQGSSSSSKTSSNTAGSNSNNGGSSNNSNSSKPTKPEYSPAEYLSPFSAVDPAMKRNSSPAAAAGQDEASPFSPNAGQQQQQDSAATTDDDKWKNVLSTNHTLSSLYLQQFEVEPFKQRDWEAKRQESDLKDVTQAGSKLGIKAEVLQDNLAQLQGLVPGLLINLDQMKASDWAKLLRDVDRVVGVVIALKTHYPKVDVAGVIKRKPRLLLSTQERVVEDAGKVKSILGDRVQDVDAIIDAVPDLMNPQQLTQSLSNLVAWFPNHDPFELLQQNPGILDAPNVEADPTYGEITTAG